MWRALFLLRWLGQRCKQLRDIRSFVVAFVSRTAVFFSACRLRRRRMHVYIGLRSATKFDKFPMERIVLRVSCSVWHVRTVVRFRYCAHQCADRSRAIRLDRHIDWSFLPRLGSDRILLDRLVCSLCHCVAEPQSKVTNTLILLSASEIYTVVLIRLALASMIGVSCESTMWYV